MVKNPPANAGDMGSIPGVGRSSGEGNGNPLQFSCLGNPMDRGAWWATVQITTDTTWKLNNSKEIYDGEGQGRQRGKDMQTDI